MKNLILSAVLLFLLAGCAGSKKATEEGKQKSCPPNKCQYTPGYGPFTPTDQTYHKDYMDKINFYVENPIGFKIVIEVLGDQKYVDGAFIRERKEKVIYVALCPCEKGVYSGVRKAGFVLALWPDQNGKETILAFRKSSYGDEYNFYGYYDKSANKIYQVVLDPSDFDDTFPTLMFVDQSEVDSDQQEIDLQDANIEGTTIRKKD